MSVPAKAGDGNPHKFLIRVDKSPTAPKYTKDAHYVSIDAVVWFVNDQSGFLSDKMVSGTIELTINGQKYPLILGQYELKQGQKVAPIFDRALITSIPFHSGNFTFKVIVQGIAQNNMVGTLLKQMATATLAAVAGAVTAETGGLATVALSAAGGALVDGAQQVLNDKSNSVLNIFNPYEVTFRPESDLFGEENYLLIHRGTDGLDPTKLIIRSNENGTDVLYDASPFRDGAWLLIRLRRNVTYEGDPRPWRGDVELLRADFDELFDQWKTGQITQDEVRTALSRSTTDTPTVADKVFIVSRRIRSDEALILADRRKYAGVVRAYLESALQSLEKNEPDDYFSSILNIDGAVASEKPQPKILTKALVSEFSFAPSHLVLSEKEAMQVTFNDQIFRLRPTKT